ncbi:uncharacterized protein LOC133298691 [Gastrolobium bilobum]|uniref:uncharacterized protein LOC133298691 n=1 Tax=Gastrolobium bilobum TaxID=150636 RepID=UPI002AB04BF9|nr:uncharacterized protein LOC133298691 [Gastrolobium bilobum]
MRDIQQQITDLRQQLHATEIRLQTAEASNAQQITTWEVAHDRRFEAMENQQHERFDEMQADLERVIQQNPNQGMIPNHGRHNGILGPGPDGRSPRLDLPRFSSGNPTRWLFAVERYFTFYQTLEPDKLLLASVHLDDPATSWFQGMSRDGLILTWNAFAFALARVYEDQLNLDRPFKSWSPKPTQLVTATAQSTGTTSTLHTSPIAAIPIKRLSPVEILARREKNLCFNYDERYSFGHKCKSKPALLYMEGDEGDNIEEQISDIVPNSGEMVEPNCSSPEISFNALFGHRTSRTFRLQGFVSDHSLQVLIDGGSTHNFITPHMASYLHLTLHAITPFSVQVGNSDKLLCATKCMGVPLVLQSESFLVDLFVIDLKGADVALGVQWLATLGPVIIDYHKLTMSFTRGDVPIVLQGAITLDPSLLSTTQLQKLMAHDSIDACLMCFTPSGPITIHQTISPMGQDNDNLSDKPALQQLLLEFTYVFTPPSSLPPERFLNHKIVLQLGSKLVQVCPYRYPHFQKNEIERLVKEMLADGLIRASQSSFSSPVLLVRKKNGAWLFCVDYRALNAVTIKDKFPIPTVDELLDELHGATIFSKLDLRLGYHQIRMEPSDIHKTALRTHQGHYEFVVMPFELLNAPSTFQAITNEVFSAYLRRFVVIFYDDILVYNANLQDHIHHLYQVLHTLRSHLFYVKLSKCSFALSSIHFLGYIISGHEVAPDPAKVQAIVDWPIHTSQTQVRAFLGLSGYYRRFIKHYAMVASPLSNLLSKT